MPHRHEQATTLPGAAASRNAMASSKRCVNALAKIASQQAGSIGEAAVHASASAPNCPRFSPFLRRGQGPGPRAKARGKGIGIGEGHGKARTKDTGKVRANGKSQHQLRARQGPRAQASPKGKGRPASSFWELLLQPLLLIGAPLSPFHLHHHQACVIYVWMTNRGATA